MPLLYDVDGVEYAVTHHDAVKVRGITGVAKTQRLTLRFPEAPDGLDWPIGNVFLDQTGDVVLSTSITGHVYRPGDVRQLVRDFIGCDAVKRYRGR